MKFTDVLTATDTNPLYYKFVPIFIKAWKKLFPDVNIHTVSYTHLRAHET